MSSDVLLRENIGLRRKFFLWIDKNADIVVALNLPLKCARNFQSDKPAVRHFVLLTNIFAKIDSI
jgi:hypothetical protein